MILASGARLLQAQTAQFAISTYAGAPLASTPVSAVRAAIGSPQGIATDFAGNVYFTGLGRSYFHGRYGVFKLDTTGALTRIAGDTSEGYAGDGGPAINAQLRLSNIDEGPPMSGVLVDADGNVYIADTGNNRIRRVSSSNGVMTTVAGNGEYGNAGDFGLATNAQLTDPSSLALDFFGNLYIVSGDRVREVSPGGMITTVAMAAANSAIAVDRAGNLYIAGGGTVRVIPREGSVKTIASEDGVALAVDGGGNVYLAEGGRVRKIAPNGAVTTVAGDGTCGYSGDGGPAAAARVCAIGVAVDGQGNLYLADALHQRVREISAGGLISTVAGNGVPWYSGDGGPAAIAQFNLAPWGGGMAVDVGGNLYIADAANQRVRKISADGAVVTVAGNGSTNGYSGDGGPATAALLSYPSGVAVDSQGYLYIADYGNRRIRKVSPGGIINTAASADGRALAIDQVDNVYFTDAGAVYKLAPSGAITRITSTQLNQPFAAAADRMDNLYFAEIGDKSYRVRKITPDGIVTTVAGDGTAGYSGDGASAASAQLNGPAGLAVDAAGNLYIADSFNSRIRMVSPSGVITTIAGTGGSGYSGDGGPATAAQLGSLSGLAIDRLGTLYAADQYFNVIRLLQPIGSAPVVTGVVNAASNLSGAIAPGELVVINGFGLGSVQLGSAAPGSDGLSPAQLAGTSVSVNGVASRLVYSSAGQVAAIIPDSVASGVTQVMVTYRGQTSFPYSVQVVPVAPAIFTANSTGLGRAATVNQGGSANALVEWGDSITLFVTGVGHATSGSVIFWPDSSLRTEVPITADDLEETAAGVTRIKVPIPYGLDCDVPMKVQLGSATSQAGVTLGMRVCI